MQAASLRGTPACCAAWAACCWTRALRSTRTLKRWLVGTDAFDVAETDSKQALYQVIILNS